MVSGEFSACVFLHTFVFSMEEVETTANDGDPMKAVVLLEEMLRKEGAVFRFTPTNSTALNSMFRENFLDDGKLESSRITLEVRRWLRFVVSPKTLLGNIVKE